MLKSLEFINKGEITTKILLKHENTPHIDTNPNNFTLEPN
jgi:hypothetical protein